MTKKFILGQTESGDYYSGTQVMWDQYYQAWEDGNMNLVERMETGEFEDFYYNPNQTHD